MASNSSQRAIMPRKNTIDLLALIQLLWRNALAIILAAVICGAAAFGYTVLMVSPTYQASASLYVNNTSLSLGSTAISINSLTASNTLVDTYIWVLKSRETLEMIIADTGVNYSSGVLSGMISTSAVENTSGFTVTVTSHDPAEAELIANSIAKLLPDRIAEIVDGTSARIVDHAIIPSHRSGPSYTSSAMKGAFVGAVLVCAFLVLRGIINESRNQVIRGTEELRSLYDLPVLATVPDMRQSGGRKYGYGYGYGYRKKSSEPSDEKKGA